MTVRLRLSAAAQVRVTLQRAVLRRRGATGATSTARVAVRVR